MQSIMSPVIIFKHSPFQQQNKALNLMQLRCETNMIMIRARMEKYVIQIFVQMFMEAGTFRNSSRDLYLRTKSFIIYIQHNIHLETKQHFEKVHIVSIFNQLC